MVWKVVMVILPLLPYLPGDDDSTDDDDDDLFYHCATGSITVPVFITYHGSEGKGILMRVVGIVDDDTIHSCLVLPTWYGDTVPWKKSEKEKPSTGDHVCCWSDILPMVCGGFLLYIVYYRVRYTCLVMVLSRQLFVTVMMTF